MNESYTPSSASETVVWFVLLLILAAFCISMQRKPHSPPRIDWKLQAKHRRIQRDQLGEAYRDDGYTLPEVLCAVALLSAALLFIPAVCFIITALMGMDEPKW